MATLIITEKASQARDLRAALGARFGQILPAEGHLLRLAEFPHRGFDQAVDGLADGLAVPPKALSRSVAMVGRKRVRRRRGNMSRLPLASPRKQTSRVQRRRPPKWSPTRKASRAARR